MYIVLAGVKMLRGSVWLLVLPNLSLGGSQRQALLLGDYLTKRGAKVTLVLTDTNSRRESAHYSPEGLRTLVARRHADWRLRLLLFFLIIPSGVLQRLFRIRPGARLNQVKLWALDYIFWRADGFETRAGREFIHDFPGVTFSVSGLQSIAKSESPQVVVSFLAKMNLITITAFTGEKGVRPVLAVCERNDVCRQVVAAGVDRGRRELYRRADLVLANSRHAVQDLKHMDPRLDPQWLPNLPAPFTPDTGKAKSKLIAVVGRLHSSKRVEMAILAFSVSGIQADGWRLQVFGDGPERKKLADLISEHHLGRAVDLKAAVNNWRDAEETPAIMILASDHEGFPNVFAEALQCSILPLVRFSVGEVTSVLGDRLHRDLGFAGVDDLAKLLQKVVAEPEWREVQLRKSMEALSDYSRLAGASFEDAIEGLTQQMRSRGADHVVNSSSGPQRTFRADAQG